MPTVVNLTVIASRQSTTHLAAVPSKLARLVSVSQRTAEKGTQIRIEESRLGNQAKVAK